MGFSRSTTSGVGHDVAHHLGRHSRWDQRVVNMQEARLRLRSRTYSQAHARSRLLNAVMATVAMLSVIAIAGIAVQRDADLVEQEQRMERQP